MKKTCENCGHRFEAQIAPGLKDACPRCIAAFLMDDRATHGLQKGETPEAPVERPVEPGDTIGGMAVLEFLGRGSMGYVYKARQPKLDRVVALKILAPRLAGSKEFTSRFNREAKALAALNHPNIVQVYDYGQEGELFFLAMEFVGGASLRQILTTQKLTPEDALRYVPQICDALEYAHSQGVIHRDIKPENILIDKCGRLKIADFGLAKMVESKDLKPSLATATGLAMGTPHYMAPEQVRGTASVDHRADIYSLGVVFYEMLTGQLPLGHFSPPSKKVQVDVRLDHVVLKSLEQEPEQRYQKISEVKTEVETIQSQEAPPLPSGTPDTSSSPALTMARSEALQAVKRPAMGLVVTGILNWVAAVITLSLPVFTGTDTVLGSSVSRPQTICAVIAVVVFAITAVMILGALKMARLESRRLALASAVLAMIVTPGNILGLPLGIWALVVLQREDVRCAFAPQKDPRPLQNRIRAFLYSTNNCSLCFALLGVLTLVAPWARIKFVGYDWTFGWELAHYAHITAGVSGVLFIVAFLTGNLHPRPVLRSSLLLVGGLLILVWGVRYLDGVSTVGREASEKAAAARGKPVYEIPDDFKGDRINESSRQLTERMANIVAGSVEPRSGVFAALLAGLGLAICGAVELLRRLSRARGASLMSTIPGQPSV